MSEHRQHRRACFSPPPVRGDVPLEAVYALHQDRTGFVWIGTQRGLTRLAGMEGRSFLNDPDDPESIPGKFIIAIGEDTAGDLWFGTYDGGCARFDPRTERFRRIDLQEISSGDRIVRDFASTSDGRVWAATFGSLTSIDPATGEIRKYYHPPTDNTNRTRQHRYTALLPLDDDVMLVGTAIGAFLFDLRRETFRELPFAMRNLLGAHRPGIIDVTRSGDDVMLVSSSQLYRLDDRREHLDLVEPLVNLPDNRTDLTITSVAPDSDPSRFWVGTNKGLLRLEGGRGFYTFYVADDVDSLSLAGGTVNALLRDRSGLLWIGTGLGISQLDLRYNFDYHYVLDDAGRADTASAIHQQSDGTYWLGTPKGLWAYDLQNRLGTSYSLGGETEQQMRDNNTVLQIAPGTRGFWVGTANGIFEWDPEERKLLDAFPAPVNTLAGRDERTVLGGLIKGVLEDREGFVWSGSDTLGMQRLDRRTRRFRHYAKGEPDNGNLPHETMLCSLEDSRGRLWFGFAVCLARYHREEDAFEDFRHDPDDPESLGNNMVTSLYEDERGRIWIGTAGGLNRIIEEEDGSIRFVRYGRSRGLPADFIVSIVGHRDELWLGTDRGLVRCREREGEIDARLFGTSDGLHTSSYHLGSAFRDREGYLCFGANAGFDRFHPDRLVPDLTPPVLVLTGLRLFNKPVPVVAGSAESDGLMLDCAVTHVRRLDLSWRDTVVTFEYSALHYRQPEMIRYAYRLEGFDQEWIDAGEKTEATYTNLDPGEYTFLVKGRNVDGLWSETPAVLTVGVEPPPWRRWWAWLLYGAAGVGAVATFTRARIEARERVLREERRIERAREEERENVRRQNAADFHDEAGTTLTRILFMTELARRQAEEEGELHDLLEKIDRNAAQLAQGMRDFIWALDPDKDTLLDTLQRIELAGGALFAHLDVTFTMQYDHAALNGITLDLNQRRQVLMICKEGLHNVARHAGPSSVCVAAGLRDHLLHISIDDDGCGFDDKAKSSGYGMKSMRERAASLGADFSVRSGIGEGTCVKLRVPLGRQLR